MMKNSHIGNTSKSYSQLFSSYFSVTNIFEESLYHDAIQMFDGIPGDAVFNLQI